MQKRLFLALALSFIVLFVWQSFIIKPQPQTIVPAANQTVQLPSAAPQNVPAPSETPQPAVPLSEYSLETGVLKAIFAEQTATIKEVDFKKFKNYVFLLRNGFASSENQNFVRNVSDDNKKVTFTYEDGQKRVVKEFLFSEAGYEVKLIMTVENLSSQPLKYSFPLALGTMNSQPAGNMFQDISVSLPDKMAYPAIRKDGTFSSINFVSFRDTHFCAIIEPLEKNYTAVIKKISDKETQVGLQSPAFDILPGKKLTQEFKVYVGPQDLKILAQANPDWQAVVYFGKLDVIAHMLLKSLEFMHSLTKNWGFAVILLSIIIYIILFPLTYQQLRSMREMQRIQPKVEALRCKYKEDPMRLQKETMALYKEHKINPLGGCLPMILQVPVFISFYLVLARSIELKGANFLWIKDLSEPDKFYTFQNLNIPFLGNELNLLPVLMTVASFFQQKLSSGQTGASASAEQQRLMMFLFPLMFFFFFYHMPSGLVLYWFTNTVLTVVQQSALMKNK